MSLANRPTHLAYLIHAACDGSNGYSNMAAVLEVCDYINKKEKSYEATRKILSIVNGQYSHNGMLALNLLDTCVKNCGHPFHLVCASKEFLNELVRKFPERPPTLYTPIQQKTLELLQEWRLTLCVNSRYKRELVHIEDMCRLLSYKGYRFPNISIENSALANTNVLKSADELQAEDQAANAAKLQEHLRRNTPEDLRKANYLMQVMAGYTDDNKAAKYEKEVEKELDSIQEDIILLNEIINSLAPGEKVEDLQGFQALMNKCRSAQVKIQKMLTDDEAVENMERLLLLNDMIGEVENKVQLAREGKLQEAQELEVTASGEEVPVQQIDLLDFNDQPDSPADFKFAPMEPSGTTASPPTASASSLSPATTVVSPIDDLLGLTFQGSAHTTATTLTPVSQGKQPMTPLVPQSSFSIPPPPAPSTPTGSLSLHQLEANRQNPSADLLIPSTSSSSPSPSTSGQGSQQQGAKSLLDLEASTLQGLDNLTVSASSAKKAPQNRFVGNSRFPPPPPSF